MSEQGLRGMKSAHVPLIAVLLLGIAITVAIGFTGQFKFFNEKGLLSGPFSALLLIGAAQTAGLLIVTLDWRIWQPRAAGRARVLERWLCCDLLGSASPPPADWETLRGHFRGRAVTVQRAPQRVGGGRGVGVWRWSVATNFTGTFSAVRTTAPSAPAVVSADLSTGDTEFEERYAWQSDRPGETSELLRKPELRSAVKRLASLFAFHGPIGDANCGLRVAQREIAIRQIPAPVLARPAFNPDELLLMLHDLTLLAALLEGSAAPEIQSAAAAPAASGGAWLAFGCACLAGLAVWVGATYCVARFAGLPAAMVAFFLPAVALAFWFMILSARGSGRDADIDAAIDREASQAITRHADLASLQFTAKTQSADF